MSRNLSLWWLRFAVILLSLLWPMVPESSAGPLDQLTDLTGKATAVVTLRGRDNFNSEYRYDVSVKNLSSDTLIGDSLFIVLDKVTNIGGDDRENLNSDLSEPNGNLGPGWRNPGWETLLPNPGRINGRPDSL